MRVIESMTSFVIHPCHIRVWRQESDVQKTYDNEDIIAAVVAFGSRNIVEIAQLVAVMPRVNAVEVTSNGQGILIYPDWP